MSDKPTTSFDSPAPTGPSQEALKAAHELFVSLAMQEASKVVLDNAKDVLPFFKGLLPESDRASGILSFAFIECQISEIFSQHLDPKAPGGLESIVGQNGILDNVGSRLRMLRALNWLGDKTFNDLRLLAHIRNRFAHSPISLTYDDDTVRGYASSLEKHETKFLYKYPDVVLSPKQLHLVRSIMTLFFTYEDLVLRPSSIRSGFGATGAFSAPADCLPIQLQYALGWCIDTVFAIYSDAQKAHGG